MKKAYFYNSKVIGILLLLLNLSFGTTLYAVTPQQPSRALTSCQSKDHKMVILIHGLMRTPLSMIQVRYFLERQGYNVYSYSYLSARNSIHGHALDLNKFIRDEINQYPKCHFYIVTHSMGGIIARDALSQLTPQQLAQVSGLIMLAPPNQGSVLAEFSTKLLPVLSYFVKPLAELSSEKSSYVHNVPIPKVKIGIIAGRYDAKVPPAATRLEGQSEPVVVNSTHTFIMNNKETKTLILKFIEKGSFT